MQGRAGLWNRFIRLRKFNDHIITTAAFFFFSTTRFLVVLHRFGLMDMFFTICMNMNGACFPILMVGGVKAHIHSNGTGKTHYCIERKHKQQKSGFNLYGYIFLHETVPKNTAILGKNSPFCLQR